MSKRWTLTQEDFERLLTWLDLDREKAAVKYEEMRRSLIKIFTWRGAPEAEDLADETFNRVTRRLPTIVESYIGDPARYFYAVANNVFKEYERMRKTQVPLGGREPAVSPPIDEPDTSEREDECLNRCLGQLSPENRELILSYYLEDKQTKIDHRKELAHRLNIEINALRVRVYRIRAALEQCIERCLQTVEDKNIR